ncbi:hypothetical protein M413DRAFT_425727 [Hebeloma cylindrosporum]|uniref:Uncharacterized protein n=1 Tax=Hebeloma cylindrosporum TaxID=76867 RepID=A0A0C2Y827_HEBCY|nr:hypothetical protein M413DRAFT_425727 [Hebeloma cylindrosporum h7]
MRPVHAQHALPAFPVYSSAFLSSTQLVLGGGGGASRSGIKNKLRLYDVKGERSIELKYEYELDKGEDAPMSMAGHIESGTIACGINSVEEKLVKGENENCRTFTVSNSEIQLLGTQNTLPAGDADLYQKVTVLSPDGTMLAVAGSHDLALLSYPTLTPIAETIHTEKEIYDASFSGTSLVIATTTNLLIYSLPVETQTAALSSSPKKSKKKSNKTTTDGLAQKLQVLALQNKVELPSFTGDGSTFRAARYHPLDERFLYTVINTTPPRSKKSKGTARHAYICKWNTDTWAVQKSRKVSDRGVTCVDLSPDGRFIGFGSSDLTIGMLDAQTLTPLVTILKAHEFPPTTIKFNPNTTLLVSGSPDNSIRLITIPGEVGGSCQSFLSFANFVVVLSN